MFIMLFVQLEFFIYLGSRLFAGLSFDRSPGETTRIILITVYDLPCGLHSCIIYSFQSLFKIVKLWFIGGDPKEMIYDFIHFEITGWFKSAISGLSLGAVIFIFLLWQTSLRQRTKVEGGKSGVPERDTKEPGQSPFPFQ